jgi:hypothetical protein
LAPAFFIAVASLTRLGKLADWALAIEIPVGKSAPLFNNGQFSMANCQFPGNTGADSL